MTELVLEVWKTYRAKKPRRSFGGEYDDRTILWIGEGWNKREKRRTTQIQYDSISISLGRYYTTTSKDAFLKWAKEEIKI